jgi:hypothetical protein
MTNPLILFDILLLPITLMRITIIYFYGSKYNIKYMDFLDTLLHSNKPYFNVSDDTNNNDKDIRCVVRDNSRLYLFDINKYIAMNENNNIFSNIDKKNSNNNNINDIDDINDNNTNDVINENPHGIYIYGSDENINIDGECSSDYDKFINNMKINNIVTSVYDELDNSLDEEY